VSQADWRPSAGIDALRLRARLNAAIRQFFAERGVLEVETPLLSAAGTVDRHIESFRLEDARGDARWLRTSPEFAMKRLLAAGVGDCYELGRVFRLGELGRRHNPEFTLLEWYRVGWDHQRLMAEVADLVGMALALVGRACRVRHLSYRELFRQRLGIDPLRDATAVLRAALGGLRIDPEGLTRDDWLDLLLTHRLQPRFDADELLFLYDYPASQSALARVVEVEGVAVAQRFEAYLGPLELANGYHELCDAAEQQRRFEAELAARVAAGRAAPAIDARLVAALGHGLPACAGVALGVDRLLALLLGGLTLGETLAFAADRA
jgi:elongation factor P--(R)-beta-lysine ligase